MSKSDHRFMKLRRLPATSISAMICCLVTAAPAAAQNREEQNSPGYEQDIIVTAQKREQSLQDVPVSVTAVTGETIADFGLTDFDDYSTLIPGLSNSFQSSAINRGIEVVGLRGVQTLNGTFISGQNTVGFYINNSPIPVMDPHLLDVERIEVLRGPQGTLYGSSSLAGTIKIVPVRPRFDALEGMVNAEASLTRASSDLSWLVEGMANVPLGPKAALRMTAYYENEGGYVDFVGVRPSATNPQGVLTGVERSDANAVRSFGGRIALRVQPAESLELTATVIGNRLEADTAPQYIPALPGYTQRAFVLTPYSDDMIFADLVAEWDLGPVQLVSSTSYFDQHNDSIGDQTISFSALFPSRPILPADQTQNNREWAHETRLLSQWGGPLQAILGVFYTERRNDFSFFLSAQGEPFLIAPIFPIPDNTLFSNDSVRNRREMAAFGEATFAVSDTFSLTAGLRAFDFDFSTRDIFKGPTLLVAGQTLDRSGEASESGVVPRFRAEFRPTRNHLLYASVAKGFRMGGANYPLPQTPDCTASVQAFFGQPNPPQSFASDSLWSYEAGAHTRLLGGRMTLNGSAYHIDWRNTQVPVAFTVGLCPFGGQSTNVGRVKADGFELEATLAPADGLSLAFNVAYNHTRVAEQLRFPNATVVLAREGDRLPNIPDWTAAMLAQYSFALGQRTQGFVRGDIRYTSDRTTSLTDQTIRKDPFTLINLRAGVTRGPWEASLFVENVTNITPSFFGQPFPTLIAGFRPDETQRPRTIGLAVRRRFGG